MWFKQLQILQFSSTIAYKPEIVTEQLAEFAFSPCLPSLPISHGFISPLGDNHEALIHALNGYMMICLRVEEKILPATVIKQELIERIAKIETDQDRKVRQKEKLRLKDDVTAMLLPKAFSKYTDIHAYIDTKNNCLLINSTNAGKLELFVSLIKRALQVDLKKLAIKKPGAVLTDWLKNGTCPKMFSIEKNCVMKDPNQQQRVIRCQQQNLFADSIQGLLHDGCAVQQLALAWHDHLDFVLTEEFTFRNIRYQDELLSEAKDNYGETKEQQFDADFAIMSETITQLLNDLLPHFEKQAEKNTEVAAEPVA